MSYTFEVEKSGAVKATNELGAVELVPHWTWHAVALRQLIAERDTLRARLAAIDQTTGELCSVCGWRTILAWGCEKCERDKLSKRIDAIECQPAIARIESLPGPKGGAYLYIMGVDALPNVSSGSELIARPAKEST